MCFSRCSHLALFALLVLLMSNCQNKSSLEFENSGQIQVNVAFAKSLNKFFVLNEISAIDRMTVQVFGSNGDLLKTINLTREGTIWRGELKMRPENNLRIKVEAYEGIILRYNGEANDVNIEAGKTTPVNITLVLVLQSTLSSIQANIFTPKCVNRGCHPGGGAPMSLASGQSFLNLVNRTSAFGLLRVSPGNANNSVLYLKVIGDPGVGGAASRMPLGFPALSKAETDTILSWINKGALNN